MHALNTEQSILKRIFTRLIYFCAVCTTALCNGCAVLFGSIETTRTIRRKNWEIYSILSLSMRTNESFEIGHVERWSTGTRAALNFPMKMKMPTFISHIFTPSESETWTTECHLFGTKHIRFSVSRDYTSKCKIRYRFEMPFICLTRMAQVYGVATLFILCSAFDFAISSGSAVTCNSFFLFASALWLWRCNKKFMEKLTNRSTSDDDGNDRSPTLSLRYVRFLPFPCVFSTDVGGYEWLTDAHIECGRS